MPDLGRLESSGGFRPLAGSPEDTAALLETILASAPIGFAFFDPELRFRRVNEALAAMNGVPVADHLGRTPREVVPDVGAAAEEALRAVLDDGGEVIGISLVGETPAEPGRVRHWDERYYPVRSAEGGLLGVGAVVWEITDRVEAERALVIANSQLRSVVEGSSLAIVAVDEECLVTVWNPAAEALFGWPADEVIGRPLPYLAPGDEPAFRRALATMLASGDVSRYQARRMHRDGSRIDVSITARKVSFAGHARPVALALLVDERERLAAERSQAELMASLAEERARLALLAEVTRAMAGLGPPGEALAAAMEALVPAFADQAVVYLLRGGRPQALTPDHPDPAKATRLHQLVLSALTAPEPGAREVFVNASEGGDGGLVIVPILGVDTEPLGALCATTVHGGRQLGMADLVLARQVAQRLAAGIEQRRLYRQAVEGAQRTARLGALSAALGAATDVAAVLAVIARESCVTLEAEAVEAAQYDAERQVLVAAGGLAVPLDAPRPESVAVHGRQSVRIPDASYLPLLVGDRLLGVMQVRYDRGHHRSARHRRLETTVADQCAQALERARLYEHERSLALVLQRSLLPQTLPVVAGLDLAADYRPGSREAEVGGDWYDVIPFDDGRIGLVIGDVAGRGVNAAVVMGQVRTALTALALQGFGPAEVLARVNRHLLHVGGGREMATCCYAVIDLEAGSITHASAGHLQPVTSRPGRPARQLSGGLAPPLGLLSRARFVEATGRLAPGETLLLFTDGLVERPGECIDEGFERLLAVATEAAAEPDTDGAASLCRLALRRLLGEGRGHDDVAVLAARRRSPLDELQAVIAADPAQLAPLRARFRGWLDALGGDPAVSSELLVALSEAATNAVLHAYAASDGNGSGPGRVKVECRHVNGLVEIRIQDEGAWRPRAGAHDGRGLDIIDALTSEHRVERSANGTTVIMRRSLHH